MHKTNGRNTQNSRRLCRHAPKSAATAPATCCEGNAAPCTDRKSTRLNSSHLVLSYAVFCLKKKKRHRLEGIRESRYPAKPCLGRSRRLARPGGPRPGAHEGIAAHFFFNDPATTEIYTLSLHDALPIWAPC